MQINTKVMNLNGSKVYVDYFESFGEMLNYVENNPNVGSSDKDGMDGWDGLRNFAEAKKLFRCITTSP